MISLSSKNEEHETVKIIKNPTNRYRKHLVSSPTVWRRALVL